MIADWHLKPQLPPFSGKRRKIRHCVKVISENVIMETPLSRLKSSILAQHSKQWSE